MKKWLMFFGLLLSAGICKASYYDLQHYTIIPDTINVTNDIYYRGNFNITSDTYTVRLASCTQNVIFYATGTVHVKTLEIEDAFVADMPLYLKKTEAATTYFPMTGTGYFKGNGANSDFSIDSTSATFYDTLYAKSDLNVTGNYYLAKNKEFYTGVGNANSTVLYDNDTSGFVMRTGADTNQIIVGKSVTQNYDHGLQTNPTLFVHSATLPDTNNTQWGSLSHDTANFVIDTGTSTKIVLDSSTTIRTDGVNNDFTIDSSSATFYDNVNINSTYNLTLGCINGKGYGSEVYNYFFEPLAGKQLDLLLGSAANSANRSFVIGDLASQGKNFDHATQTNPTLFVHSATNPDTDNTQWMSFAHDQTNGVIGTGKGSVSISTSVYFLTGSATVPSIADVNDTDTGIYFTDGNYVDITAGGTRALSVSSRPDYNVILRTGGIGFDNNNKGFYDSTGVNELIVFSSCTLPVNYFTIKSASTTFSPTIQASGDDSNIGLDLCTKGSGNVKVNGTALINPTDYAICITSPTLLGTGATLISPFRSYAYTISSATIRVSGGTNVIGMIEQRAMDTPDSAGTDIWTGDITATTAVWQGGTANDFTVPANYGLFFVPTSVSGDVGRLMIKYSITKD